MKKKMMPTIAVLLSLLIALAVGAYLTFAHGKPAQVQVDPGNGRGRDL